MRRIYLLTISILFLNVAFGSEKLNYPVAQIPDSIKENAYSVVRYESTHFEYLDKQNGILKMVRVVTILDEKGNENANFEEYTGKTGELKSFSGEIYDQNGKSIKKIKQSDLLTSTFSAELASDEVTNIYHCNQPIYPYTIKYEYEVKFKNGIVEFPAFAPLNNFNQSLQEASYTLKIPSEEKFAFYSKNLPQPNKKVDNGKDVYSWQIKGLKAIEEEPYMANLDTVLPVLKLKPDDFVYETSKGSLRSWADVGTWNWSLVKDRDELPAPFVDKLKEMVSGISSDREKVKKIYEYLQKSCRYVSIQLGIGGYQPITALNVNKTGFGDCKGLSNYLKAMLKAVGINSDYTIIHNGDRRNFLKSYPSPTQANHVILTVPIAGDTIPLECTSAYMPFGYVHDQIAGHDALLITPEGGKLIKIKSYPDSVSFVHKCLNIKLDKDGLMKADVNAGYEINDFEEMLGFEKTMDNDERMKDIRADYHLPSMSVSNISCIEKHDEKPCMTVKYNIQSGNYATKSGTRLFFPVNPLRNSMKLFSKKARKFPFVFESGMTEIDTIHVTLPDGFLIESQPSNVSIRKSFGLLKSTVTQKGNNLQIVQQVSIKKGTYPASVNDEMKDFILSINNTLTAQIVLKAPQ